MKVYIFLILIILFFFSCKEKKIESVSNQTKTIEDKSLTQIEIEDNERNEKIKIREDKELHDNLNFDRILKTAEAKAAKNVNKSKFNIKYSDSLDLDLTIDVELKLGKHFTKRSSHLIIYRRGGNNIFIDIYSKTNRKYKKIAFHNEGRMTYINDTIRDINGDGIKDFVVNWYASSGCCLKGFSNVYLIEENQKSISKNFEFINPTFSPKEGIIRGICYGHPGETEMYKYKWNGNEIDTIEYISFERNSKGKKTGKILATKNLESGNEQKIIRKLNSIPNEYKKIYDFDWFLGSLN